MSRFKIFFLFTILTYPLSLAAQVEIGIESVIQTPAITTTEPILPSANNELEPISPSTNISPQSAGALCEVDADNNRSVAYQCAKGVINNVIDTVMLPVHILRAVSLGQQKIEECNQDPEIKKGLLLVIEPILKNGISDWMSMDCGRLMEVARLQEEQATTNVMRKLRLQNQLEDMISKTPLPHTDDQRDNFKKSRERVALTNEENLFWQRKTLRDLAIAKLSDPSIERVWDAAKQKWKCLTAKEVLVGLCNTITSAVIGGATAIVARNVGREVGSTIRNSLTGSQIGISDDVLTARLGRIDQQDNDTLPATRSSENSIPIEQAIAAERLTFQTNAQKYGMKLVDRKIIIENPKANPLTSIIDRMQRDFGVTVSGQDSGFAKLVVGTNPDSGKTFLNIAPNFFEQPQAALKELKALEEKLIYQRRTGVFPDTSFNPPRLIVTDANAPLARSLTELQNESGLKVVPSSPDSNLTTIPLVRINREAGIIEVHPALLKPGMEGRFEREVDRVLRPQLSTASKARETLISLHGATVDAAGNIIVLNPTSNIGKMIAALSKKGIRVNIAETNFENDMARAAGFAREDDYLAIQPQFFLAGREKDLLSLLNHEITHNTTARRAILASSSNLTPTTQNIYAGRNVWLKSNGSFKFEGIDPMYQHAFRNDELEARLRELPIDTKIALRSSGLPETPLKALPPTPINLAARSRVPISNNEIRREALAFADQQMDYIRRALNFSNTSMESYSNGTMVTFNVKAPGGSVSVEVLVSGTNISTAEALLKAKEILKQRLITVEAQRRRLRN